MMDYYDTMDFDDERISRPGRHTNIISPGDIGGVGHLIYHNFRFAGYELSLEEQSGLLAYPVCDPDHRPDLTPKGKLTGKDILVSLCNLAGQIDDESDENNYWDLIVAWCVENMHPYAIDFMYKELTADTFDINDNLDVELAIRDGIFSVDTFMRDLEKLYNAARFYYALVGICYAEEDAAFEMYTVGKHFEALPFFEHFKLNTDLPTLDVSGAEGDLLKEMEIENEYFEKHPHVDDVFQSEPYDEYEELREKLVDCIPDFRLRLRTDPKSNRLVFAADVNSVFDIAWYTLARMMAEDPAPEDFRKTDRPKGVMIRCAHCGRFFFPRDGRQKYCADQKCQNARNAYKQKRHREKAAQKKARAEKSGE